MRRCIRDALEALRPVIADHPCAQPVFTSLDGGGDAYQAAAHIVNCDQHHRSDSQSVLVDLIAALFDYRLAATPEAHPARALLVLDNASGRAYAQAIAAMYADPVQSPPMNARRLEPATWPPRPDLAQRRWAQRLLVGMTHELDTVGRGHHLLVDLLSRLDEHTPDQLIQAIGDVDHALVSLTDTAELLDLARPLADVHTLLRRACQQRTAALSRMRRLVDAHRLGLPPTLEHARSVLREAGGEIIDAGRALAHADQIIVTVLGSTKDISGALGHGPYL